MLKKKESCFISITLKSWSGRKISDPTTYNVICNYVSVKSAASNFIRISTNDNKILTNIVAVSQGKGLKITHISASPCPSFRKHQFHARQTDFLKI